MTKNHECSEQRFLDDVKDHKMTILREDGLNRHIRFRAEKSTAYWFDIITYGGRLIIDGDMGTYVFARIEDMFDFFRTKKNDWNYNKDGLSINPSYWGEKLRAVDNGGYGTGKIKEFSRTLLEANVKQYFDLWFEDEIAEDASLMADASEEYPLNPKDVEAIAERATKRGEVWAEIENDIFSCSDNEYAAYDALHNFDYEGFEFEDFSLSNCNTYTFHYIWCCYAIAWAIMQYDLQVIANSKEACSP